MLIAVLAKGAIGLGMPAMWGAMVTHVRVKNTMMELLAPNIAECATRNGSVARVVIVSVGNPKLVLRAESGHVSLAPFGARFAKVMFIAPPVTKNPAPSKLTEIITGVTPAFHSSILILSWEQIDP